MNGYSTPVKFHWSIFYIQTVDNSRSKEYTVINKVDYSRPIGKRVERYGY